jgi:hypothetical protein
MKPSTRKMSISAAIVAFAILLLWALWWRKVPQIGADEQVVKAVDALFTAITSRDTGRLDQCEQRLHRCMETGSLPTDASHYLNTIIQTARAGRWQSAARRLYEFMRGQRQQGRRTTAETRAVAISTDSPGMFR